jgi:hypothetical protein
MILLRVFDFFFVTRVSFPNSIPTGYPPVRVVLEEWTDRFILGRLGYWNELRRAKTAGSQPVGCALEAADQKNQN